MKNQMPSESINKQKSAYLIQIEGNLPPRWSVWFHGLEISVTEEQPGHKITNLFGEIEDQAALFGVLEKIRDLGLPLLSVQKKCKMSTLDDEEHA